MGLLKFGWLKNGSAQIWLAQKWVCSNLGWLKFGLAQIWVGSNLAAQIRAAQICLAQIRDVILLGI